MNYINPFYLYGLEFFDLFINTLLINNIAGKRKINLLSIFEIGVIVLVLGYYGYTIYIVYALLFLYKNFKHNKRVLNFEALIMFVCSLFVFLISNINSFILNTWFLPHYSNDVLIRFQIVISVIISIMLVSISFFHNPLFSKISNNLFLKYKGPILRKFVITYEVSFFFIIGIASIAEYLKIEFKIQWLLILCFLFLSLSVIILTGIMFTYNSKMIQLEEIRNSYINKQLYWKSFESNYKKLRKLHHDYTNLLITLIRLIENNDFKHAKSYANSLLDYDSKVYSPPSFDIIQISQKIYNQELRALFLEKVNIIKSQRIKLHLEISDKIAIPSKLLIDLLIIISNLLDNATSAALQSDQKSISISLKKTLSNCYKFTIKNSIKSKINIEELFTENFSTKKNHMGIGLNNVISIIDSSPNFFLETKSFNEWIEFELILKR